MRITRDCGALRHDDGLDALAMAVAYWSEYLSRDISREEDKRLEELMEIEYAKFAESDLRPSTGRAELLPQLLTFVQPLENTVASASRESKPHFNC